MDALQRVLGRLRRQSKSVAVTTSVETIAPVVLADVGDELRRWAHEAGVEPGPVDGVWWRRAGADDASPQGRPKGFVALQFHGGGYMLGSAKEVQSGFSRASFLCRDLFKRAQRRRALPQEFLAV